MRTYFICGYLWVIIFVILELGLGDLRSVMTYSQLPFDMFHVFVLAYSPPNSYFAPPPPHPSLLDDVTFEKWSFEKMSGGLGKNSKPLPRSWDLEEFPALL